MRMQFLCQVQAYTTLINIKISSRFVDFFFRVGKVLFLSLLEVELAVHVFVCIPCRKCCLSWQEGWGSDLWCFWNQYVSNQVESLRYLANYHFSCSIKHCENIGVKTFLTVQNFLNVIGH